MPDILEEYDKAKERYDQKQSEKGPTIDARLQAADDSIVSSGFEDSLSAIQAAEAAKLEQPIQAKQAEEVLKREALDRLNQDLERIQKEQNAKQGK